MYEQGKGGPKDLATAADTFALGCAKGGCARAGALYEKGAGGKPDLVKAQAAYDKGCQSFSHVDACFGGARLLEKKDKGAAKDKLAELCTRTKLDAVCQEAKKLGATLPADLKTVKALPPPGPNCRTPFTCTDAEFEAYKKDLAAHAPKK